MNTMKKLYILIGLIVVVGVAIGFWFLNRTQADYYGGNYNVGYGYGYGQCNRSTPSLVVYEPRKDVYTKNTTYTIQGRVYDQIDKYRVRVRIQNQNQATNAEYYPKVSPNNGIFRQKVVLNKTKTGENRFFIEASNSSPDQPCRSTFTVRYIYYTGRK